MAVWRSSLEKFGTRAEGELRADPKHKVTPLDSRKRPSCLRVTSSATKDPIPGYLKQLGIRGLGFFLIFILCV